MNSVQALRQSLIIAGYCRPHFCSRASSAAAAAVGVSAW